MNHFILFSEPWWVNLFIFIPIVLFYLWKQKGLKISKEILIITALFGIAFGFVEASVVFYLRTAAEILSGYSGALSDVARFSANNHQQAQFLGEQTRSLLRIELFREIATIVMLISVAFASIKAPRERFAIFIWTFAIWDIFYYVGFWTIDRWPQSLLTPDILFLIPTPWLSQVWFPITVSTFSIFAVIFTKKTTHNNPD